MVHFTALHINMASVVFSCVHARRTNLRTPASVKLAWEASHQTVVSSTIQDTYEFCIGWCEYGLDIQQGKCTKCTANRSVNTTLVTLGKHYSFLLDSRLVKGLESAAHTWSVLNKSFSPDFCWDLPYNFQSIGWWMYSAPGLVRFMSHRTLSCHGFTFQCLVMSHMEAASPYLCPD